MLSVAGTARWARELYYGWWIVAAGLCIAFMGALHTFGFPTFFLPLTRDLKLSRARTSFVFSATRLESGIEGPFIGWAIDRFGPKMMMLVGGVLAGLGYILIGVAVHGFWSFFLIYVFVLSLGFTTGFFQPLIAAFNLWFIRQRSVVNGSMGSGFRLGGFVWAPVVAFFLLRFGWRPTAIGVGVFILASVLPLALVVRRSPESMGLLPDGDKPQGAASGLAVARSPWRAQTRATHDFSVREALRTRTYWMFTLAAGMRTLAGGAIMVHIIPMLVWKGLSEQAAANLFGLTALVAAPLALAWGFLGDRWPAHRVYAVSVGFAALGLAVLTWGTEKWHLYLFAVCWGFSESGIPLTFSIMGNFFGRKSFATLRGIQTAVFAVGGFATPVFAGWVYDRTGSYLLALAPGVVAMAVSVPLFLALTQPHAPRAPSSVASGEGREKTGSA